LSTRFLGICRFKQSFDKAVFCISSLHQYIREKVGAVRRGSSVFPKITHVRAFVVRGGGADYHDQGEGHWIDDHIATPMSRYPEYRQSFGINVLGKPRGDQARLFGYGHGDRRRGVAALADGQDRRVLGDARRLSAARRCFVVVSLYARRGADTPCPVKGGA
jgi:hypothetical protein